MRLRETIREFLSSHGLRCAQSHDSIALQQLVSGELGKLWKLFGMTGGASEIQ